jgi:hypothetical protein
MYIYGDDASPHYGFKLLDAEAEVLDCVPGRVVEFHPVDVSRHGSSSAHPRLRIRAVGRLFEEDRLARRTVRQKRGGKCCGRLLAHDRAAAVRFDVVERDAGELISKLAHTTELTQRAQSGGGIDGVAGRNVGGGHRGSLQGVKWGSIALSGVY